MYNHNLRAEEIRERQDFFHQQGRIDRLAREARRAEHAERPAADRTIVDRIGQALRPRRRLSRWAFHGPAH